MMIENGFFPYFEERVKKKERRKKNVFSNLFILSIIVCAVVDHFDVRDGFVDVVRFDVRLYAHDDFVDVVY